MTLAVWLLLGFPRRCGVHRRRRGAHHRVPVRARPRDADRAARRHRPRRAARHPDQGSRGARVDPHRRHGRARQDRHRDERPDVARRRRRGGRRRPRRAAAARGRARARLGAPHRPGDRRGGRGARPASFPQVESFAERPGHGVSGVVDGHAVIVGRRALLADWALRLPADLAAAKACRRGSRAHRGARGLGRRGARRARGRRPGEADQPRGVAQLRALGLTPMLLTGDNAAVARTIADEVGIDRVIAEVLPAGQGRRRSRRCRPRAASSRWSATA